MCDPAFWDSLPINPADDPIVFGILDGISLAAPESFWRCPESERNLAVNGCGPKGIGDALVPDTIFGVSITPACQIHDWMFTVYNCRNGFILANSVFKKNMERINLAWSRSRFMYWLRSRAIRKYYSFCRDFGEAFYLNAHTDLFD